MHRKTILPILVLIVVFTATAFSQQDYSEYYTPSETAELYSMVSGNEVRNVILLIGDGMGLAHVNAARFAVVGPHGSLHMERFPVTGYQNTYASNNLVTDSAASGSAMASGVKTENGMISMTPDGRKHVTILELARDRGMSTGLVATSTITHATPASFASHVRARSNQQEIARQIIETGVDVILGGGRQFFIPQSETGSEREDDLNIIENARKDGYKVIGTKEELHSVSADKVLGLFQVGPLTTQDSEPMIGDMTAKAIELLSRDSDGFFLMVEGSQIDWESHDNNWGNTIRQTLLFDMAVKCAVDFALKDGKTLVIVTADHETGGLVLTGGSVSGKILTHKWASESHTGISVPVFAYGPGAIRFTGVRNNTYMPDAIAELLDLGEFPRELK